MQWVKVIKRRRRLPLTKKKTSWFFSFIICSIFSFFPFSSLFWFVSLVFFFFSLVQIRQKLIECWRRSLAQITLITKIGFDVCAVCWSELTQCFFFRCCCRCRFRMLLLLCFTAVTATATATAEAAATAAITTDNDKTTEKFVFFPRCC